MKPKVRILSALVLLAYLATGLYQVRQGERAVVRRFGRVLDEPRSAGLHIGLPWGLDRVDRVAVDEQRRISVGFEETDGGFAGVASPGQVVTGDGNLIDVRVTIYYHVDPAGVVSYVLNSDRIEGVLARAAEVALAGSLAGQRIDPVLLGQARNLEPHMQESLVGAIHSYELGVAIDSVNVTYLKPPPEVADVFQEVNRSRSQKERAIEEARGAKEAFEFEARAEAARVRNQAEIAHTQQVRRAEAEAHGFRLLWQKVKTYADADSALLTLYLTEMQNILSRMQVRTLMDKNTEQTIFLPLPEK